MGKEKKSSFDYIAVSVRELKMMIGRNPLLGISDVALRNDYWISNPNAIEGEEPGITVRLITVDGREITDGREMKDRFWPDEKRIQVSKER